MKREIIFESVPEALWPKAAESLVELITSCADRQTIAVGLCGGRSVGGLLSASIPLLEKITPDLQKKIHFFMLDERVVPLDSPDSNFGLVNKSFFEPLITTKSFTKDQIHPFEATPENVQERCDLYLKELESKGGFAVIILGMGEDGHVAGLFPKHPGFLNKDKKFVHFTGSPKPPPVRMSASVSLLKEAKGAVLLAIGDGKREAYRNYMDLDVSANECPAKLVDTIRDLCIVTDLG